MYISMAQKYIMKHSQQNMLSNKNPPHLFPKQFQSSKIP